MNLSEAFKRLELLDEDVFNLTKDGLEDLKDFEEDSDDKEEVIDVMDPDAESEEDLEDSYIGKVILDCEVCHTDIYKDKEDITIDEETQLANVGEECPYCFSNEGFTIIGEVKPFVETTFETNDDVDVEVDGEEVEKDEEEEETESLHEDTVKQDKSWVNKGSEGTHGKFRTKKAADAQRKAMFANGYKAESMRKSLKRSKKLNEGYNEDINRIYQQLKIFMDRKGYDVTDHDTLQYLAAAAEYIGMSDEEYPVAEWYRDTKMNYPEELAELKLKESLKESCSINQCQKWVDYDMKKYKKISDDTMEKIKSSGYSVVKDQYGDYEVIADRKDESCGDRKPRKMKESIEDIVIDTGDQEISVSAKDKEEVKSEDEMIAPLSDEVKTEIEDKSNDMADVDIDEFSEEEFDELGESYLKKVYENVSNYKTTSAKIKGNKLYLEGLIKFNSGKTKKTSFIFESKTLDKNNKAKFIGENVQISRGHKSFKLTGTLNNNKFIAESLNYNYKAKDGSGNSKRIYGTVKVK